ncbi:hypothetical protein SAMN05216386_1680 [Nitrosospira briensis]|uniref:Surface-adhesin protein E-like domain-containing protein n=1 Tax=Nitrosospira briensis TaxID=35799 RepID=A0A1I5BI29_9PROT|nr:hypothetical protein SAMN05216386_1680 [Nitrosospira briensis]
MTISGTSTAIQRNIMTKITKQTQRQLRFQPPSLMRNLRSFGFGLSLLCGLAHAEWVEVSRGPTGQFSFDPSLVTRLPDGKISAWVKVQGILEASQKEAWEAFGVGEPYSISRFILDCGKYQSAVSSIKYYTNNGKPLLDEVTYSTWEFKDITPGTVGDTFATKVCTGKIR